MNIGFLLPWVICIILVLNILYILYMYSNWSIYFKKRLCRDNPQSPSYETNPCFVHDPKLIKKKKITELHMDHVYLHFKDFLLLIAYLVLPNSVILWVSSIMMNVVRGAIIKSDNRVLKKLRDHIVPR